MGEDIDIALSGEDDPAMRDIPGAQGCLKRHGIASAKASARETLVESSRRPRQIKLG